MQYPLPIEKLIDSYRRLPGIGAKTAARLAFFSMDMPEEDVLQFANALISVKRDLTHCSICGYITQESPCLICCDEQRNRTQILVVEDSKDVISMERMGEYKGLYHILGGVLSPMDGIGPDDLSISSLIQRLQDAEDVQEIIIATNPTAEGEATAKYIARLLKPANIMVTRLAHGLAVGSDIEYADEMTLLRAIEGRRTL
ncbi:MULTISPECIES: recombination mediator RecR [unclassified Granulicatella]|uniref:recombination mediator RecR n=1 Tax=unclassified Granulicatella TaxID=2630493 RepID=UPI0010740063|nr:MULTISPECIES: recombination mediator RecR [unclassified Granulicatella]MBF0779671.1 recombination protein RecR [Granulicatella sp. 19428wC4_WM01]TFU96326.1 recombination protein RecR [Granulicatella sp. WM01]